MSKKRGKSSSAPGGQSGRWESDLIAAPLEEENWKVCVCFIVENQLEDGIHIKSLANVVKIPQRKLFSYVHKDDLMDLIEEIGNPKTRKTKELPHYFEITETIKGLMDAEKEIPIHLWAKLIKFGLLNAKEADMKRREMESKTKAEKGKGSGKKRPRSKSPGKAKGKKTPEPQLPKKDWSTLKKRGEEDTENKYIDDEPDDGPNHYIFVSGFRQPQLFPILSELGINISTISKLYSESYEAMENVRKQMDATKDVPEEALAAEKAKKQQNEKDLTMFWKLLPVVLQRAAPSSNLQDLARLEYVVADTIHPSDWADAEKMIGYGTTLFEDIACLVYDSLDWRRQYLNYLKNMNLLHVPTRSELESVEQQPSSSTEPVSVASASGKRDKGKAAPDTTEDLVPPIITEQLTKEVDMRYYNDLMDLVPQESVSVPLVMHCMLEQIVATEEYTLPPSEIPRMQRKDGIHLALADCISGALENLALTEEERKALASDFPSIDTNYQEEIEIKNKKAQAPSLMQYGDDTTVRTHHLDEFHNFNPKTAEEALLRRLPCARLWNYEKMGARRSKERSARLQELLRHCASLAEGADDIIPQTEVDRAFRQFVFETINLSTTTDDGTIRKPLETDGSPWDDPYTHAVVTRRPTVSINLEPNGLKASNEEVQRKDKQSEEGQTEEKEKAEEEHPTLEEKRNLDNWCFAEHFHPEVLLQVLTEASDIYPILDTYHHKRDNSLLAVFHCPMNKKLQATESWASSLHSDVGFRNYLEYVSASIQDWTRDEEGKYQAEQLKKELEKLATQTTGTTETSATPPPSTGTGKRPRSKSPKKGSRRESASRSSSKVAGVESNYSNPYIRAGSLKAQSEEKAKIREEEERKKAEKESKQHARVKSADKGKGAKSASSKTSQDGKRPGSGKGSKSGRRSPKSKSRSGSRSRSTSRERETAPPQEPAKPEDPRLPFTGYDVGNNLINLIGKTNYLYPCDGGIIKAEKIVQEQGTTYVSTTMKKDGHTFVIHMVDPKDPEADKELAEILGQNETVLKEDATEKAELESAEKEKNEESLSRPVSGDSTKMEDTPCHSKFGSWNAVLCDGMTLSFSSHGENGECKAAGKTEQKLVRFLGEIPPAASPSPLPPGIETPKKAGKGKKSPRGRSPRGKSPKGKRKSDSEKEAEAQREVESRMQEELERKLREAKEEEERNRVKLPPFNQLYASTPDGLTVRYQLDPTTAGVNYLTDEPHFKLMVRQSYPYKTGGKQKTESLRAHPAMEEVSRCIRSDGTVIKVKKDGSSMILFADGTTCYNQGTGPLVQERKVPVTPHSMPSAVAQQLQTAPAEEQRNTASPGSKKGSKGRKSSGKTNPETTATEPSLAGTGGGGGAGGSLTAAAGLEADAGASAEADLEKASSWHTIRMDGESFITKPGGETVANAHLLCYSASDPVTDEVLMSREDHVIRVERPDGSTVCEHSDGTRITQYSREIEKPLYDGEAEDGDPSVTSVNTVRHVRVECPGYATVSFNCDEGSCLTVFGSGTNLLTTPDSTYQMSHWGGGRIEVDQEGTVTYTPRPDNDLYATVSNMTETEEGNNTNISVAGDTMTETQVTSLGSYIMRHNSEVCCEAIDHEGNVFQVKKDGEVNVINPLAETTSNGEGRDMVTADSPSTLDPLDHHPPRFFIIHGNGSGTELLRFKDVQEYLADAELDPTTAVIKEPLPDTPGVVGITVMRPHFGNSSEAWICQKMEENIIPENIHSRDLALFPHREEKKPGPPFASTVGKGLAVGSAPSIPEPPPTPPCPSVLELRQLVQYKPITKELRGKLRKYLVSFGNHVREQEERRKAAEVEDGRSWEEKVRASDLLTLVLEFDDGQQQSPKSPMGVPPTSAGIKVGRSKGAAVQDSQSPDVIRAIYEETVTPPPLPKPDPPRNKLTQDDWDRIKRSIDEEKLGREALKYRDVPPYFESEEGRAWLMIQAPDMEAMSRQLARDPRTDGTEAKMSQKEKSDDKKVPTSTSTQGTGEPYTTPSQSRASENGASTNIPVSNTPSKMRPTNPTPAHASGKGTPTKVRPDNPTPIAASSQPGTVRPSNPTPSHAYGGGAGAPRQTSQDLIPGQFQPSPIPENPTSAQRREGSLLMEESSSNDMVIPMDTSGGSDLILTRSLLYNVKGEPRKDKVRLPASILSDKPATIPNRQFTAVEEPVRRKVKTSSVADSVMSGTAKRGFNILPPEIVFGVLREGNTYSYTARLKNTGIDTCRFKVRQPPPGTGLRVHYAPGPVAAGMDTLLHVECYAIAVGVEGDSGVGTINHQLLIVTETETLALPISAIVLTGHDYDNRTQVMPPGGKAPGVRLLSAKPPSREGIIRPMKINA